MSTHTQKGNRLALTPGDPKCSASPPLGRPDAQLRNCRQQANVALISTTHLG